MQSNLYQKTFRFFQKHKRNCTIFILITVLCYPLYFLLLTSKNEKQYSFIIDYSDLSFFVTSSSYNLTFDIDNLYYRTVEKIKNNISYDLSDGKSNTRVTCERKENLIKCSIYFIDVDEKITKKIENIIYNSHNSLMNEFIKEIDDKKKMVEKSLIRSENYLSVLENKLLLLSAMGSVTNQEVSVKGMEERNWLSLIFDIEVKINIMKKELFELNKAVKKIVKHSKNFKISHDNFKSVASENFDLLNYAATIIAGLSILVFFILILIG